MAANSKYALITGATSGIGYELAKLLAQDQYHLIIVARHPAELSARAAEFKQQYGVDVITLEQDLAKPEGPFKVYEAVKAQGVNVEVLVNNAGQGQYGQFVDTDIDRELEIVDLNIKAYLVLTKLFLKDMVTRNAGKILMVSSIGGELPGPWQAVYHATKAFVSTFTEAIQNEIKDTDVTITKLLPGVTDTDFFNKADMEEAKMVKEGSKADPAEVARDGYQALMAGKAEIISGLKNKVMVAASKLMPDSLVAENMQQQAKPSGQ
ncbi:SDR family NAD(P)-dependent oxidoreductase [Adhaeribacter pallidiroseus]|uniref:3-oxoacyl-[acyl-carrier-protein] reductase n=1 Tax=Adhaeribacter pallidiroseus TaxID=2072847 RepID=A0A369QB80_9BACT|nr:SDR family oxidoreductase [Adhaeribacter pallidiroseus]RDC62183.1 3-oxoacyl-[acyl-carrier-protein] reductase [Adhaeribacter pallidiroseus]